MLNICIATLLVQKNHCSCERTYVDLAEIGNSLILAGPPAHVVVTSTGVSLRVVGVSTRVPHYLTNTTGSRPCQA